MVSPQNVRRGATMPDSQAKAKWIKENTTVVYVKLNHNTDKLLLQYLEDKPSKAGVFKAALREYIQNHPEE